MSKTLYPNNRPESFKVQIPRDRVLSGKWEVALVDIQFPHTWTNISKDSHVTLINAARRDGVVDVEGTKELFKDVFPQDMDQVNVTLAKGYYPNATAIANSFLKQVKEELMKRNISMKRLPDARSLSYTYDAAQHRGTFKPQQQIQTLHFSDDAGGHFKALGLTPDT